MRRSSMLVRITATVALFTASLATAGAAQAAPDRTSEQIARAVYTSPDPEAAVKALSPSEKQTFAARIQNFSATETFSGPAVSRKPTAAEQKTLDAAASASSSTLAVSAAAIPRSGCWSQYQYYTWKDLGFKTGNTWMTANWCTSNSVISSYSLTGQGGQGQLGLTYDGLGQKTVQRTNFEAKQAQIFKFHVERLYAQPCMQIRGKADGTYYFRNDCNLS